MRRVRVVLFTLPLGETSLAYPKQITNLGTQSLEIYKANIPAIYAIAVIMCRLTPRSWEFKPFICWCCSPLAWTGPLLLMWLVRRTAMRKAYRQLFG